MTVAAVLHHDVVEDTTADYRDVEQEFGAEVACMGTALRKDRVG